VKVIGVYVNPNLKPGIVTSTENYIAIVKPRFYHPEGYTLVKQEMGKDKRGSYYRFEEIIDQDPHCIDMSDYNQVFN